MPQSENLFTNFIYNVIFFMTVSTNFTILNPKMPHCASEVFPNRPKVFKKKTTHPKMKTGGCKIFTRQTLLKLLLPSARPGLLPVRRIQGK